MPPIRGSIIIARPVEAVFDFVADVRNQPSYDPEVLRVDLLTEHGVGVGARWSALIRTGRWPTNVLIDRTEDERPFVLGSTMSTPDAEIDGRLTFEAVDDGTRIDGAWHVRPRRGLRLPSRSTSHLLRRQRAAWTELRRLLESSPEAVRPDGASSRVTAATPPH